MTTTNYGESHPTSYARDRQTAHEPINVLKTLEGEPFIAQMRCIPTESL